MLFLQDPRAIVGIAIALVVGITFHEFSHAFTADQLGDHQPRALGRVSLNPMRHIDPLGALFFVLAGFGWGRPVPVRVTALRPGRIGLAFVAGAGPIANVVVAVAFGIVARVLDVAGIGSRDVDIVIYFIVLFNLALAIFNLLPVPPLDGFNMALGLLPSRQAATLQSYQQYGFFVLLGIILLSYVPGAFGPIDWIFALARGAADILTGQALLR